MSKIFKNSSFLITAQVIAKFISFAYIVFLARQLGVDNFGIYITALSYFALMSAFSDFGFNRYLIREGAKNPGNLSTYVFNTLLLRLVLVSVSFAIFAVILYLLDKDSLRVSVSLLAVLAIIPQAASLTFDAALLSTQRVKKSSIGIVVLAFFTALLGLYFVSFDFGVIGAAAALIFGQIIYSIVLFLLLFASGEKVVPRVSEQQLKSIFVGSLPYGVLAFLGLVYFRIDTILLSYLRGPEEVGLYGAAYKFLEAIIVVPSAVFAAIFPVAAKLESKTEQTAKLYLSSLTTLAILSLPVVLGYLFILPLVINYLLPSYSTSIGILRILSLAIPFMFIQVPAISVLFSSEKYLKKVLLLSSLTVVFNLLANLMLIPLYGLYAAAWITVASEVLSFMLFYTLIKKEIL